MCALLSPLLLAAASSECCYRELHLQSAVYSYSMTTMHACACHCAIVMHLLVP